jgi:hypothetical protein
MKVTGTPKVASRVSGSKAAGMGGIRVGINPPKPKPKPKLKVTPKVIGRKPTPRITGRKQKTPTRGPVPTRTTNRGY